MFQAQMTTLNSFSLMIFQLFPQSHFNFSTSLSGISISRAFLKYYFVKIVRFESENTEKRTYELLTEKIKQKQNSGSEATTGLSYLTFIWTTG